MGGGGKGGASQDWNQVAGQNAYNAAAGGQSLNEVLANSVGYEEAAIQGYNTYQQPVTEFHMPSFENTAQTEYYSDEKVAEREETAAADAEARQAELDAAEALRLETEGLNKRDALYGSYLDAANSSSDYVNTEINNEIANARLLGIDYQIDDQMKSQRVNDYFSTVWGDSDQQELEALMTKWGNPEGFEEFTVVRGDGGSYGTSEEGSSTSVGTSSGISPKTLATDDDEEGLGGYTNVLGV